MVKAAKITSTIALESGQQKSFSTIVKKLKRKAKKEESSPEGVQKVRPDRGLVYLSHIPHGFYEHEIQTYFKQFGDITNVRVLRSHDTGRSKGAAFVEFKEPDVAKIAAETMDNYLMFKRRIEAKYIKPEDQKKTLFKVRVSARNFPKKKRITAMRQAKNMNSSVDDHQRKMALKLKKMKKQGMLNGCQVHGLTFDVKGLEVNTFEDSEIEVKGVETRTRTNRVRKVKKEETQETSQLGPVKVKKIKEKQAKTSPIKKENRLRPKKEIKSKEQEVKLTKTMKKTKVEKQPLVINPKFLVEKMTTRTTRGKATLAVDSSLFTAVNLDAIKKKKRVVRTKK